MSNPIVARDISDIVVVSGDDVQPSLDFGGGGEEEWQAASGTVRASISDVYETARGALESFDRLVDAINVSIEDIRRAFTIDEADYGTKMRSWMGM